MQPGRFYFRPARRSETGGAIYDEAKSLVLPQCPCVSATYRDWATVDMGRRYLIDPRVVDWDTDSADRALLISDVAGWLNEHHRSHT